MQLIIYGRNDEPYESLEAYLDALRSSKMTFLASSLLEEGLSPSDIMEALRRATTACRTAGLQVEDHFKPVYSSYRGSLVRDCKLTRTGYLFMVINAPADSPCAANWQYRLIQKMTAAG